MIISCSLHLRMLAILALLLISCTCAFAHAVVTDTSLNVTNIASNISTQIQLTFNSKIELDLSQILLVSAGDKMQLLHAKNGKRPGTIKIDLPPLKPGEYALKLKIFASDGHLSEDLVRFNVTSKAE